MITASILDYNFICLLSEIFKYASPILVGMESVKSLRSREIERISCWIKVLETTRILIAHCSIMENEGNEALLKRIALNIRNLYRLFGLDLSEKDHWREINEDKIWFVEPNDKGGFYIDLKDNASIYTDLKDDEYYNMFYEFDNTNDDENIKNIFGHCLYVLVATSDGKWKTDCQKFKTLISC